MATYDPLDPAGDPFGPPAVPTSVGCLHCGQEYDSYLIEWRIEPDAGEPRHVITVWKVGYRLLR